MTYTKHYRLCHEILKAAEQAVLCPGNLHLPLFHTLSPIYKIFHGAFMVALGMKRIDWQHVEKCFEQSSLLVLLLLGRVDPVLLARRLIVTLRLLMAPMLHIEWLLNSTIGWTTRLLDGTTLGSASSVTSRKWLDITACSSRAYAMVVLYRSSTFCSSSAWSLQLLGNQNVWNLLSV